MDVAQRTRPRRAAASAASLAASCHPLPCLAVTAFGTALGISAGNAIGTLALLAAALLCGQLSIGWGNDLIDVARDRAVGRTDKPLARDPVLVPLARRCVAVVLVAAVALSLALGWRAGLLHLAAVGCGWAYNVRLKSTAFSWLPYAAAFGALPAIAALAVPASPAWWAVVAGALVGVAAHLANTVPDLAGDARSGVHGFPHRLGARNSLLLATVLLLAGAVVLVLAPAGSPSPARWAGLALAAAWTALGGALAARRPGARWAFPGVIAVVALDVVLLLAGPSFAR